MAQSSSCNWEMRWDTHTFAEDDIKEIASTFNQATGETILLKPEIRYAALVDTLIVLTACYVGISSTEFFKKFGAKLGDKIGEEIGNDLVKVYSKIKGLVVNKLVKNKSDKGFHCLFEVRLDGILISAVIHGNSDDVMLVSHGINRLDQAMTTAGAVLSEFDIAEDIVDLRLIFDGSANQWKPLFLATKQNVYEIERT